MRKAESERSDRGDAQAEMRSAARRSLESMPWMSWSGTMWEETLKWMEFWQGEMRRVYGIGPSMFALRGPRHEGDMRRASDMPWVPRMEAQVIPLRRNTDPPGSEARRFSMRLPLPWGAGTNVVAVETIVGTGEGAQPHQPGEQTGEGPVTESMRQQRT